MTGTAPDTGGSREKRTLLYSHDTFGLGHLRRSRTIATSLVEADPYRSALIVTGSPIAGRFDFPERVDHVRLPGVVKLADGSYTSSNLPMDIDQMVALRRAIIASADHVFEPDLMIIDKEAWGFRHELTETLSAARGRGARIVLGIRDVLDDEDALAREWERKNAVSAIETYYDEIWVYGIPQICKPLAGLGLSSRMEHRVVYTGYLRRDGADWPAEPGSDLPDEPYILVTTGGGGDGAALVDWVLRAYEADRALKPHALIVYGPFMNAAHRHDFDARVAALGDRVTALSFHPRLERLLAAASGVVAMGGYNTFCEILSTDKPAIIAPRTRPAPRAADPRLRRREAGPGAHALPGTRRNQPGRYGPRNPGAADPAAAVGHSDPGSSVRPRDHCHAGHRQRSCRRSRGRITPCRGHWPWS